MLLHASIPNDVIDTATGYGKGSKVVKDLDIEQLIPKINAILNANERNRVYLKWTCPKCGERVTADRPNTVYLGGYLHRDCGELYEGREFGMMCVLEGS